MSQVIKETTLLKVKTLSKSHAKQIEVVQYNNSDGSLFKTIALNSHPERGDCTITEVLGWVSNDVLADIGVPGVSVGLRKFWLIKHHNQLYWFPAPTKGEAFDYYMTGRINQLFV